MIKRSVSIFFDSGCEEKWSKLLITTEYQKLALFSYVEALMKHASTVNYEVNTAEFLKYCSENDMKMSKSNHSKRLNQLLALEIITSEGGSRSKVFTFTPHSFNELRKTFDRELVKKNSTTTKKTRTGSRIRGAMTAQLVLDGITNLDIKSELALVTGRLYGGLFDNCMRDSHLDPRKEIKHELKLGSDSEADVLEIQSACLSTSDSDLLAIPDLRLVRVLDTYISNSIKSKFPDEIRNRSLKFSEVSRSISLDLTELFKSIGLRSSGVSLESVSKMLFRLRDTRFLINTERAPQLTSLFSKVLEFIGESEYSSKMNNFQVSYFSRFNYENTDVFEKKGMKLPRVIVAEIDAFYLGFLCLGLMADNAESAGLISTHEELKTDRTIFQKINGWIKPHVGVKGRRKFTYTYNQLHEKAFPNVRTDNGYRDFRNQIKKRYESEMNQPFNEHGANSPVSILGYYWHWEGRDEVIFDYSNQRRLSSLKKYKGHYRPLITIWRDTEDDIVGDKTYHNKKLISDLEKELNET